MGGICPKGWHLPSKTEWETLIKEVGGPSKAVTLLKSKSEWNDNMNGVDAFGFSAYPAGFRGSNGLYSTEGEWAYFWSSTEDDDDDAYCVDLSGEHDEAQLLNKNKKYAFSVRCVKDEVVQD